MPSTSRCSLPSVPAKIWMPTPLFVRWAMVSASKLISVYPIDMFGLFNWPALSFLTNLPADQMKPSHDLLSEAHHLMAKVIVYGLVPLHVLGALKHQFIDKDNTLARMIPFLARKEAA